MLWFSFVDVVFLFIHFFFINRDFVQIAIYSRSRTISSIHLNLTQTKNSIVTTGGGQRTHCVSIEVLSQKKKSQANKYKIYSTWSLSAVRARLLFICSGACKVDQHNQNCCAIGIQQETITPATIMKKKTAFDWIKCRQKATKTYKVHIVHVEKNYGTIRIAAKKPTLPVIHGKKRRYTECYKVHLKPMLAHTLYKKTTPFR